MPRFFSLSGIKTAIKYTFGNVAGAIASGMAIDYSKHINVMGEFFYSCIVGLSVIPITYVINGVAIPRVEAKAKEVGVPDVNSPDQTISTLSKYRIGGAIGSMTGAFFISLTVNSAPYALIGSLAAVPVGAAIIGPMVYLYKTSGKIGAVYKQWTEEHKNSSSQSPVPSFFTPTSKSPLLEYALVPVQNSSREPSPHLSSTLFVEERGSVFRVL